MRNLKKILQNKLHKAKKIALLGVGAELRGDDAVGESIAREVKRKCKKPQVKVFFGATAPENLTGEIKKFHPTHVVIIDAADLKKKPGAIALIEPEDTRGVSFSTHQLPFKILSDYLVNSLNCKVLIIGIQPELLRFGCGLSAAVSNAARQIREALCAVLKQIQPK